EIDWLRPDENDPTRAFDALQTITAISARSWKSVTGNSLEHAGPQAFARRLVQNAQKRGWLSVWILRLEGRPAAMELQLIADGAVYALRSDFDASLGELSPGSHLNGVLLEQLFDAGLRRYVMGPGENAYKYRWTDQAEEVCTLTSYGPTVAGGMLAG